MTAGHDIETHHGARILTCLCGARWDGDGAFSRAMAHMSDIHYATHPNGRDDSGRYWFAEKPGQWLPAANPRGVAYTWDELDQPVTILWTQP